MEEQGLPDDDRTALKNHAHTPVDPWRLGAIRAKVRRLPHGHPDGRLFNSVRGSRSQPAAYDAAVARGEDRARRVREAHKPYDFGGDVS